MLHTKCRCSRGNVWQVSKKHSEGGREGIGGGGVENGVSTYMPSSNLHLAGKYAAEPKTSS